MKILYTSDIHAGSGHLSAMLQKAEASAVDVIIIGGDIVAHELPRALKTMPPMEGQAAYLKKVFIPAIENFIKKRKTVIYLDLGNDDFFGNRAILEKYAPRLFNLLHFKKSPLTKKMDIIGYMVVPPTPFTRKDLEKPDIPSQTSAPGNRIVLKGTKSINGFLEPTAIDLDSEDTIEKDLTRISEMIDRPFVFVSHSPPFNTPLDVLYDQTHVGSVAISNFIHHWAQKGKLMASFHGHIHESPARSGSIFAELSGTQCINPGQGNGNHSLFKYVIFNLPENRKLQQKDFLETV